MGGYSSPGAPGVRGRPLKRYAVGESLPNSSGGRMYAGFLPPGSLALTFCFFKFEIPVGKRHLKILFP